MKPRTASTLAIVTVAAAIELAGTADPAISAQERPAAQSARVVLDGNGLGVTRYGATRASATKALTAVLGKPTGHPAADCTGKYRDTAWHDLVVQFLNGRLHGYRYPDGRRGVAPTRSVLKSVKPKLKDNGRYHPRQHARRRGARVRPQAQARRDRVLCDQVRDHLLVLELGDAIRHVADLRGQEQLLPGFGLESPA